MESKTAESVELCSGNKAAAYGALLSRPDVVAIYPITPQTAIAEWISRFSAQGALDAEIVEVEGENSAMGVVCSASAAGGRVFTATSSWGLAFMTDGLFFAAARRLPVVMVNVNRETPGLPTIGCGRQDMMSCRDTGWIQIEVETCQEILDTVLMAYLIAEDPMILLPVMISYDGFYLSHLEERVVVPKHERVARLHERVTKSERMVLRPEEPRAFGGGFGPESCTEFRYRHSHALDKVPAKLDEIEGEFESLFGRRYGGAVEEYRMGDAEIALLTMGSSTGASRVVVDNLRDKGVRIGLVKVRLMRPFPKEQLLRSLSGKKAVGVLDRSVCFGWSCGHLFMEVKAALFGMPHPPTLVNFIGGLANSDITTRHIEEAVDLTARAAIGEPTEEVVWLTRMRH